MARIRGKDTLPELRVRSVAHRLGFRFRLHRRDLPGTPDLVFAAARKVIFVHGCFWHGHACKVDKMPKSRVDYWAPKIVENRLRDARKRGQLRRAGWTAMTIWECQTLSVERLESKLEKFLSA